jgi:predicted metal-dependent phosphoesterase TrpH
MTGPPPAGGAPPAGSRPADLAAPVDGSRPASDVALPARPPGERWVDLHAHTRFSDGLLTPEALVDLAVQRGLVALAITDHDTVEGLPGGEAAARGRIEFVPGIELSTAFEGIEYHLLGYHFDSTRPALRARLESFRLQRLQRVQSMAERLSAAGVPVVFEDVVTLAGPGVIGRPHLAAALVQAGHADSVEDAFRRFIGRGGVAFIPRPAPTPEDAIALLAEAGGVAVLAHPGASLPDAMLERMVDAGLAGVEVWHPHHPPGIVRRFRTLAAKHGLVETGGSDYHGPGRSADLGASRVPARVLEALKRAAGR